MLRAGTSGFSYAAWRGVFYPERLPGARMLDHYAQRLGGVELNGSFYRLPPEPVLRGWSDGVPEHFRFCLKASRGLTYSAAAFDKAGLAALFAERSRLLGARRGPVLLQWPPTRSRDEGLLDALLEILPDCAVEFREPSWFDAGVERVLRRHGAAMVVTDEEKWPRAPVVETAPFAYFRLRRDYDEAGLRDWARTLAPLARAGEVHAYFRHEPEAPARAIRLLELVS